MLVPDPKKSSSNSYRYGFQGQEKDDEIKGEGNSLNYTFRMHDPRVGRFFAVDPLEKSYPYYSPYQFSGNRVIDMIELEGLEPTDNGTATDITKKKPAIRKATKNDIKKILAEEATKQSSQKPNTPKPQVNVFTAGKVIFRDPVTRAMIVVFEGVQEESKNQFIEKEATLKKLNEEINALKKQSEALKEQLKELKNSTTKLKPIEVITDDPSSLDDHYLAGVIDRISKGESLGSDQNYIKEAISRKNSVTKAGKLFYAPTEKHKPGGWGTTMDLDDNTAFEVLNNSETLGKQKYGLHEGTIYEFQPDNAGGYHGYPIPGIELVNQKGGTKILREWEKIEKITKAEYNKLSKQSKL